MLLTMVEIVCCENPKCREFARVASNPHRLSTYYCPVCSKVSNVRVVDINVADSPDRLQAYLLERMSPADRATARTSREAEAVWY